MKKSCVTDLPVKNDEDFLKTNEYANGLTKFILNADSPITIGIQGGWGSGKTSLIKLLIEKIKSNSVLGADSKQAICVSVNAWEHSLFASAGDRGSIAISLLNDIISSIYEELKIFEKSLPPEVRQKVMGDDGMLKKAINMTKKYAIPFLNLALPIALKSSSVDTGSIIFPGQDKPLVASADMVRELRSELSKTVKLVTTPNSKDGKINPVSIFVCFVDDLDRVHPQTAVEILDVLKNIFEIKGCVFVLSIDYEVVVKGLIGKFGEKTEANEREFRQYFDKIIQIPFTMPIGAYQDQMAAFIEHTLEISGQCEKVKLDKDTLSVMRDVASWTTDGVPRTVKRVINTMSLLNDIDLSISSPQSAKADYGDMADEYQNEELTTLRQDMALIFTVISLHLQFPEVCLRLVEQPDFLNWRFIDYRKQWALTDADYNEIKGDNSKEFNEEWEKVVYCLCAKNAWLKARATNVSQTLNALRTILEGPTEKTDLSKTSQLRLDTILQKLRVVSVDMDSTYNFDDSNARKDRVTLFFRNCHFALKNQLPWISFPEPSDQFWAGPKSNAYRRYYKVALANDPVFREAGFEWLKQEKKIYIYFYPKYKKAYWNVKTWDAIVDKLRTHLANSSIVQDVSHYDNGFLVLKLSGFASKDDFNFQPKGDSLIDKATCFAEAAKQACHEVFRN